MMRGLKNLFSKVLFSSVNDIGHISILPFLDASHAGLRNVYGQTGVLTSIKISASKRSVSTQYSGRPTIRKKCAIYRIEQKY